MARVVELVRARRRFALVVPNKPALEHVKNEAARLAGRVDPMAFFTVLGLARKVLGSRVPRLASPRERDGVLERALRALAADGRGPVPDAGPDLATELRSASRFRGFRRSLLHFFAEVEALGVDVRGLAAALRRSASSPYQRALHARLAEAYRAYKAELARAELVSEPDVLARAARALERRVEAPGFDAEASDPILFDAIIVDGFVELAPRQLELLLALSTRARETEIHRTELNGADARMRNAFADRGFEIVEPAASAESLAARAPAIDHVLGSVFAAPTPRDTTDGAVSFVRAGSPADEALSALKIARAAVLERGRAWNDVLVVVPDAREARASFERAARELSVPVRVHASRPLVDHPAVRGALAFARAAATQATDDLLAAAASPATGVGATASDGLAREARRSGAKAVGAVAALAPRLEPGARAFVRDVLDLGRSLGAVAPSAPGGRVVAEPPPGSPGDRAFGALRRALRERLRGPLLAELSLVPDAAALEAASDEVAALQALDALLGELAALFAGESFDAAAIVERLEAEAAEADYTPRDRRRLVVHVVDLAEARSWRASVAIVCGLTEGSFPRPWRTDLLLDEGARRAFAVPGDAGVPSRDALAGRLLTGDEHALRERQLFLHAVACARDELHLVHAAFDERGEPCVASPFVAAVEALFTAEALGKAQRKRAPSDLVARAPGEIVTFADARRFAFLRAAATFRPGSAQEARARLGAALLERVLEQPGEAALVRRALARPLWRLDHGAGFAALEHVYSASELETYASCAYKHFVQHVLEARRRDELAVTGLDARLQGKVVHGALERAVRAGGAETPEAAFDAAFAEVVKDLPLGPDEEAFRRSARAAIAAFLSEDDPRFLARTGLATSRVELAFGPDTEAGPLLVEDPALGGAVRMRGQIDRIDEGPRGAFVTDYKLGKDELDGKTRDAMARGEKLQLQVYLLAVARVLGKVPLGASLVALRSRRRTGIVRDDARDLAFSSGAAVLQPVDLDLLLAGAEESIRRIVREIARGRIDARPRAPKDCRRCDVRDVCRFRERPSGGAGA